MLSMVFSSSVFAANEEKASAWDSFLGLFSAKTAATSDVGVEYRGHIQNVGNYPLDGSWIQGPTELGTEGKGLRLEGFWIQLNGDVPADAHIEYQVHVQNVGWMDPVQDGEFAGTEGKSQQIEAIKISLVDDEGVQLKDYSVVYTGHVQNKGDVGPYTNGEQLGTDGEFLRLEAITVEIVKNPADLDAYEAALAAVTQADYTAASWTTYQAVVNANVVDEDNLQSEVDAATANITAAQASLVKILKVESVTALNLREIDVKYNRDLTDAEKLEVVKFANIEVYKEGALTTNIFTTGNNAAANVLDDNKTVRVTLKNNTPLVNYTTANKVVIKKAAGLTADYTKTDLAVTDTTLPTVISAESTGAQDIVLTFSEPLNSTITPPTNITLNNGSIGLNLAGATYNDSKRQLTVAAATTLAAGDYTIKINSGTNLVDAAGFGVVPASLTFKHTPSTGAPTATVKESTEKTVTLVFSAPIQPSTLVGNTNVLFTHTYNTATNQVTGAQVTNPSGDKKTFVVAFTNPLPPGASTMWMKYTTTATDSQKIKDTYNNIVAPAAFTVNTTADTTAPTATVTGVSGSNTQIDIQFNKAVTGATTASNFVLKKGTTVVGFAGPTDQTNNKYRITANAPMQGDYTLEIKNIKDTSAAQNLMPTQTFAVTIADTIAPFVTNEGGVTAGTNFYTQGANTKIRIYFSEAMNTSDLSDLTKYQNAAASNANPTVATPSADGKSVYLEFAAGVTGNLAVGSVRDVAGNVITGFAATLTGTAGATVGLDTSVTPAANRVVADSTTTVKLYLADAVTNVTVGDFEIRKDAANWVSPASYLNDTSSGKSVITLTLATSDALGFDAANAQVRSISAANTQGTTVNAKNQFGIGVNIAATNVTDKIVPVLVDTNPIQTMDIDGDGKIDHIRIEFKEAMQQLYVTPDRFTVSGYAVVDAFAATVAPTDAGRTGATIANSQYIYVTVTENTTADSAATPSVIIASGLRDVADNIYAGTTLTSVDKAKPVITSAVKTAANALTLTFSESVYAANDGTGSLAATAIKLSPLGTVADAQDLATIAHTAGSTTATATTTADPTTGTSTVGATATSVYDAAGNVMLTFTQGTTSETIVTAP